MQFSKFLLTGLLFFSLFGLTKINNAFASPDAVGYDAEIYQKSVSSATVTPGNEPSQIRFCIVNISYVNNQYVDASFDLRFTELGPDDHVAEYLEENVYFSSGGAQCFYYNYGGSTSTEGTYNIWLEVENIANNYTFTSDYLQFKVEAPPPPDLPDLEVRGISGEGTSNVHVGETFKINTYIKNTGEGDAKNSFQIHWYKSTSSSSYGEIVANQTYTSDLNSGYSTGILDEEFNCTTEDTFYFFTRVDKSNNVEEEDDYNNYSDAEISPGYVTVVCQAVPKPDLIGVDDGINKTSVQPGGRVTLSLDVKNIGEGTANSGYVDYYFSKDSCTQGSSTLIADDYFGQLSPNNKSSESHTYTIPDNLESGTYYYSYFIDHNNTIDETSNSNNSACFQLTISLPNYSISGTVTPNSKVALLKHTNTDNLADDIIDFKDANSAGFYSFDNLELNSTYAISVSKKGYLTNLSAKITISSDNPNPSYNTNLTVHNKNNFLLIAWLRDLGNYEKAVEMFEANSDKFDYLNLCSHYLDEDGGLSKVNTINVNNIITDSHKSNVAVNLTVMEKTNSGINVNNVLKDGLYFAGNINEVVNTAVLYGFDGVDIDYENFDEVYRSSFTAFIRQLDTRLEQQGKTLSVTIQADRSLFDVNSLLEEVDYLPIMFYDMLFPDGNKVPQSHSEINDIKNFLNLLNVSNDKIVLALPNYGYNWDTVDNKWGTGSSIVFENVMKFNFDAQDVRRDDDFVPSFFHNNDRSQVWFEDKYSLWYKLTELENYNAAGTALWRLGEEDDSIYKIIREYRKNKDFPRLELIFNNVINSENTVTNTVQPGENISLSFEVENHEQNYDSLNYNLVVNLLDKQGNTVYDSFANNEDLKFNLDSGLNTVNFSLDLPNDLEEGNYDLIASIRGDKETNKTDWSVIFDTTDPDIADQKFTKIANVFEVENIPPNGEVTTTIFIQNPILKSGNLRLRDDGCYYESGENPTTDCPAQNGEQDRDYPALNQQRSIVQLSGLTDDGQGNYQIKNDQVAVYNCTGSSYCFTAIDEDENIFTRPVSSHWNISRGDPDFEAVMNYYHLNQTINYIKNTVENNLSQPVFQNELPIKVAIYNGPENYYSRFISTYFFILLPSGPFSDKSVIDVGEEIDTILHEFGHAILYSQAGKYFTSAQLESKAVAEGFADYWSVNYSNNACRGIWKAMTRDDGVDCGNGIKGVRDLSIEIDYDDFAEYDPENSSPETTEKLYRNATIWSSTLWQIRSALGADLANAIILESHFYYPDTDDGTELVNLERAAEYILLANSNLKNDERSSSQIQADRETLQDIFTNKKIIKENGGGIGSSPQCSDNQDNDGDGLIDYPNDPGCADANDNDEYNDPASGADHKFETDEHTVGLWYLNGDGKDSSGNGHDLTVQDSRLEWIETPYNKGVRIAASPSFYDGCGNGGSQVLKANGSDLTYLGGKDWTIDALVKINAWPGDEQQGYYSIISHYSPGVSGREPYQFNIYKEQMCFFIQDSNNKTGSICAPLTDDIFGKWIHVTAEYEYLKSLKLYLDGQTLAEEATDVIPESSLTWDVYLGSNYCVSSNGLEMDEVRVSNITRGNELLGPDHKFEPDEHTVGLWYLNGNGEDAGPNNFDLAVYEDRVDWINTPYKKGILVNANPAFYDSCFQGDRKALQAPGGYLTYPGSGDWTIDSLIKFDAWPGDEHQGYYSIASHYSEHISGRDPYQFRIFQNKLCFLITNSSNQQDNLCADLTEDVLGQWLHVAAEYQQAESINLYLNGQKIAAKETNIVPETNASWNVYFGSNYCVSSNGLQIDEMRVSNTAHYNNQIVTACNDGQDNDGDGLTDYPNDPDCESAQDEDEYDNAAQLVLHYNFEEGISSVVSDQGEYKLAGTTHNVKAAPALSEGQAASFDGTSSYIKTEAADALTNSPAKTIAVWVKGNDQKEIRYIWDDRANDGLALDISNGILRFYNCDGGCVGRVSIGSVKNDWMHVVAVYDTTDPETGAKLYLNGELVDEGVTREFTAGQGPTYFGGNGGVHRFFSGILDDIRIYRGVLTPEEVQTLYNEVKPPQVCPFLYDPVCGTDNQTYSNSCIAELHSIYEYETGTCEDSNLQKLETTFDKLRNDLESMHTNYRQKLTTSDRGKLNEIILKLRQMFFERK